MCKAAGQHTVHQLVCKVAQMGVIWNSFFGRHHRSVAKVSVSRSDELCEGLSRGFSADYRAAVPAYEKTLETRVRTKAGLSGQSLQVVSDVFINVVGRAEIVGV